MGLKSDLGGFVMTSLAHATKRAFRAYAALPDSSLIRWFVAFTPLWLGMPALLLIHAIWHFGVG